MNAAELMKRSEHALRTGQTVNLFPVLARRTLQQIEAERTAARLDLAVSRFVPVFARVWNALADQVAASMGTMEDALQAMANAYGYEDAAALIADAVPEGDPTCKHCNRPMLGRLHTAGDYCGKMRCDPDDSGRPYGYNAEPLGQPCGALCLGYTLDQTGA